MAEPRLDPTINLALIVGLIASFVAMIRNAVLLRRDVDDNKKRLDQREIDRRAERAEYALQMATLTSAVDRLSQSQGDITTILTTLKAVEEFGEILSDLRASKAEASGKERERRGARDILSERHRD